MAKHIVRKETSGCSVVATCLTGEPVLQMSDHVIFRNIKFVTFKKSNKLCKTTVSVCVGVGALPNEPLLRYLNICRCFGCSRRTGEKGDSMQANGVYLTLFFKTLLTDNICKWQFICNLCKTAAMSQKTLSTTLPCLLDRCKCATMVLVNQLICQKYAWDAKGTGSVLLVYFNGVT